MGYTPAEILDFWRELLSQNCMGIEIGSSMSDLFESNLSERAKHRLTCYQLLVITLWKLRAKHVPTALSRKAGCNWRIFADEVVRYARYSSEASQESSYEDGDYWKEPKLPTIEDRAYGGYSIDEIKEVSR